MSVEKLKRTGLEIKIKDGKKMVDVIPKGNKSNPMEERSREVVTSNEGEDMCLGGIMNKDREATCRADYKDLVDGINADEEFCRKNGIC